MTTSKPRSAVSDWKTANIEGQPSLTLEFGYVTRVWDRGAEPEVTIVEAWLVTPLRRIPLQLGDLDARVLQDLTEEIAGEVLTQLQEQDLERREQHSRRELFSRAACYAGAAR